MGLRVDWRKVLDSIGLDIPERDGWSTILCPLHDDHSASMGINLDLGCFICHACEEKGTLKKLIAQYTGASLLQVEKLIQDAIYDFRLEDITFDDEEIEPIPEISMPYDFVEGKVPEWIFERGYNSSTLMQWKSGVLTNLGSLAMPILDMNKRQIGWFSRQPKDIFPRYLYPRGMKKALVLFGSHMLRGSRRLCLNEGPLDTVWMHQNGYDSVALLGAHLSSFQEVLIRNMPLQEVILCFDSDEAGIKCTKDAMVRLQKYFVVSTIEIPKPYKDVQDVRDSRVLRSIIKQRSVI